MTLITEICIEEEQNEGDLGRENLPNDKDANVG